MELKTTKELAYQWWKAAQMVLDMKEIAQGDMEALLAETRANLAQYQKESLVPKEVVRLFLEMEEFLCLASIMEDTEFESGFYHFQEISGQVQALKESFFDSEGAE